MTITTCHLMSWWQCACKYGTWKEQKKSSWGMPEQERGLYPHLLHPKTLLVSSSSLLSNKPHDACKGGRPLLQTTTFLQLWEGQKCCCWLALSRFNKRVKHASTTHSSLVHKPETRLSFSLYKAFCWVFVLFIGFWSRSQSENQGKKALVFSTWFLLVNSPVTGRHRRAPQNLEEWQWDEEAWERDDQRCSLFPCPGNPFKVCRNLEPS